MAWSIPQCGVAHSNRLWPSAITMMHVIACRTGCWMVALYIVTVQYSFIVVWHRRVCTQNRMQCWTSTVSTCYRNRLIQPLISDFYFVSPLLSIAGAVSMLHCLDRSIWLLVCIDEALRSKTVLVTRFVLLIFSFILCISPEIEKRQALLWLLCSSAIQRAPMVETSLFAMHCESLMRRIRWKMYRKNLIAFLFMKQKRVNSSLW